MVLVALAAWGAIVPAAPGQAAPAKQVLAKQVNDAIDRGVAWLKGQQKHDGSFPCDHWCPVGSTALATYALLKSGVLSSDPVIQKAIGFLRYQPFEHTYAVSVEIAALDALGDKSLEETILGGARWLEEHQRDEGIWGYPDKQVDLSNTQYAALGMWVAERHGFQAKRETWGRLLKEVTSRQNGDGGFGYREKDPSTGSMTTSGLALLMLSLERVEDDPRYGSAREKAKAALERGWKWLEEFFTVEGNPHGDRTIVPAASLYYLFGLERVGAIGERNRIGGHDWYAEGARRLVLTQADDGKWHDGDSTSFALLFLRRATFTGMHVKEGEGEPGAKRSELGEAHRPFPQAPFVRRWLVCGPIADPKDSLLEAPYGGEENVEAKVGASFRGRSWTELRALDEFIGFGPDSRPGDRTISYAFTWLHAASDVDAVVWIGSDDGVRLFLDGKPLLTRHVHAPAERDKVSAPVHLAAGVHPLLVKVENHDGSSGFFLRLVHPDGSAAREIRPSLSRSDLQLAATALSMPGLFTLAELSTSLPLMPRLVVGFDARKELDLFAFGGMSEGKESYPDWIDVAAAAPFHPAPGARGILAVRPLRKEIPGRFYFRAAVPQEEPRLSVRIAEEGYGAPGKADFVLRLGVFEEALVWLCETTVGPDAAADTRNWRTVEAPLDRWKGKELLFVVECAGGGAEPWNFEQAYFDEIAIR